MKENLYYLFLSGLILGSGPCLSLCGPLLVSYSLAYKTSLKKAAFSYLVFSTFKVLGYILLGLICSLGVLALNSPLFESSNVAIYITLGVFILVIGLTTIFYQSKKPNKICEWIHSRNIKNVGLLGLLIGLSPCLPLIGILQYIILISDTGYKAILFSFIFGMGTVVSPLFIFMALSGRIAEKVAQNNKIKLVLRILCGLIFIFLGIKVILQTLLR